MGVLTSNLFTKTDQQTVNKLENCATGQPNESQSHFTIGQTGEHIKKAQEALKSVQEENPSLGIPDFSVNGVYDQRFANAIRVYKTKEISETSQTRSMMLSASKRFAASTGKTRAVRRKSIQVRLRPQRSQERFQGHFRTVFRTQIVHPPTNST